MQPDPNLFDGKYEFLEPPKQGGMSIVVKARERLSGLTRALKYARSDVDPRYSAFSFDCESRALFALKHPNIVMAFDQGITHDHQPYLVLEWLPRTLDDLVADMGPMSWSVFYGDIGRPLLEALRYAHNRRIAHRDLKPRNVLLDALNTPKIADFGISRWMDKVPIGQTLRGAGSFPYTPPEPDDGIHSFGRDCYSWSVIAISCLIGRKFANMAELQSALTSLSSGDAPIAIFSRALSLDPSHRYLIAGDLSQELEAFNRARLSAHATPLQVQIYFSKDALTPALNAWNLSDADEVKRRILSDINEQKACEVDSAFPDRLVVVGTTCRLDAEVMEPTRDRLRVLRTTVMNLTQADRSREGIATAPFATFTDHPDGSTELKRRAIKELFASLINDATRREADRLAAEREQFYDLTLGFLREKERFYRDHSMSVPYKDFRRDGEMFSATLEGEVDPENIDDSLVVNLPNSRPVAFEVAEVQVDRIRLRHKSGPAESVPLNGTLQTNRISEFKALGKQRMALETIRSGTAVSPILGALLCEPEHAVQPEISGLPSDLGDISSDKRVVLDKALGVHDFLVVEGPPGTGKTTLIAELIARYLQRYPARRILLSSQTHVAVDHVIAKLREKHLDDSVIRIAGRQEDKVDKRVAPLILERKVEAWVREAAERSRRFIEEYATRVSLKPDELRAGILGEERLWRIKRIREIDAQIAGFQAREDAIEQRRKARIEANELVDPDQILEETSTIVDQKEQLTLERNEHIAEDTKIRARLLEYGEYGRELSTATEEHVAEWVIALLPQTPQAAQVIKAIELHHKWLERLGVSHSFAPAVLSEARVVAGTCVGLAGVQAIFQDNYDICILDEASKATITEAIIPMSRSRAWVLVGDPRQLPPFFEAGTKLHVEGFTDEEVRASVLDYLLAKLPKENKDRLLEQRRMVEGIGSLVGTAFYKDKGGLKNIRPDTDRDRRIAKVFRRPVTWISTTAMKAREELLPGDTFCNRSECEIVVAILRKLSQAISDGKPISVAVVAGYAGQVRTLKEHIGAVQGGLTGLNVECNTVDAFQGRDADVCLYSVTRTRSLGFQREKPRLNVALSRGRDALVIVGNDVFCRGVTGENPFPPVLEYIDGNPDSCEINRYESSRHSR